MKRIVLLLIVISLVLGTAAYMLLFPNTKALRGKPEITTADSAEPEISNLVFCDLVNDPKKYHGQIIRLHARLTRGLEGAWFSDPKCGADNAAIAFSSNQDVWRVVEQKKSSAKKAAPTNGGNLNDDVDLIAIGKFINVAYDEGGLITPFQFEILKIE